MRTLTGRQDARPYLKTDYIHGRTRNHPNVRFHPLQSHGFSVVITYCSVLQAVILATVRRSLVHQCRTGDLQVASLISFFMTQEAPSSRMYSILRRVAVSLLLHPNILDGNPCFTGSVLQLRSRCVR